MGYGGHGGTFLGKCDLLLMTESLSEEDVACGGRQRPRRSAKEGVKSQLLLGELMGQEATWQRTADLAAKRIH